MRVSSTALRHIRELELLVVVACLAIVPVLCCLTHHMLELHRHNEICVPFQFFMSTFPTMHSLMMSCISTLSSFELVLEFFLCVLFVRLSSSSGIRIASRLCSRRMLSAPFSYLSSKLD